MTPKAPHRPSSRAPTGGGATSASSTSSHSAAAPVLPRADTALVISGAVAQGAFAAGALEVLARRRFPIGRIVASSSGALTGTVLAAGIRAGRIDNAIRALVELWTHSAHWGTAIALSGRDLVRARGLSTSRKLRALLRDTVEALVPGARLPIDLRLVTTALAGDPQIRRDECATSFESVLAFAGRDFDDAAARERLYTAATASAAFPGVYAPVQVSGVGQCLDGGAVNNAPIKHALDSSSEIRRVILIAQTPTLTGAPPLQGLHLAEHLADILVHERLYRDIREARAVNRQLAGLEQLVIRRVLTPAALSAVRDALGWQRKRRLELLEIRPTAPLRGGAFTALSDQSLREEYIAEGRRAAEDALVRYTPMGAKT